MTTAAEQWAGTFEPNEFRSFAAIGRGPRSPRGRIGE